jgi:hypothetical protein
LAPVRIPMPAGKYRRKRQQREEVLPRRSTCRIYGIIRVPIDCK